MKKLILLFVSSLLIISCDVDDDGPRTVMQWAEVTDNDLPEFFEPGETHDITITYLLPTACHTDAGLQADRGSRDRSDEEYRDIYVAGIASYDASIAECDEEGDSTSREKEVTFKLPIGEDEEDPYTFYLYTGEADVDGELIYNEVVVPVGEPETPGEETPEEETPEEETAE